MLVGFVLLRFPVLSYMVLNFCRSMTKLKRWFMQTWKIVITLLVSSWNISLKNMEYLFTIHIFSGSKDTHIFQFFHLWVEV